MPELSRTIHSVRVWYYPLDQGWLHLIDAEQSVVAKLDFDTRAPLRFRLSQELNECVAYVQNTRLGFIQVSGTRIIVLNPEKKYISGFTIRRVASLEEACTNYQLLDPLRLKFEVELPS